MKEFVNKDISYRDKLHKLFLSIAFVALGFLVGLILIRLSVLILRPFYPSLFQTSTTLFILGSILLQGVGFGGVSIIYQYLSSFKIIKIGKPVIKDLLWIILGIFSLFTLNILVSFIFSQAGVESATNIVQQQGNRQVFLIMIPISFLLIGPGEELLFRGVVQGVLKKSFNSIYAVLIASIIFSVAHFTAIAGGSRIAYIFIVFTLALILGVSYEKTDNILVPSLIHGSYNAVLFFSLYLTT